MESELTGLEDNSNSDHPNKRRQTLVTAPKRATGGKARGRKKKRV
jgi:hypothetical protein